MFTKKRGKCLEQFWCQNDGFLQQWNMEERRFMLGTCLQKHNFACQKTHSQKDDVLLFCFVTLNNGDNKHCMDWNCETSELLVVLPLL